LSKALNLSIIFFAFSILISICLIFALFLEFISNSSVKINSIQKICFNQILEDSLVKSIAQEKLSVSDKAK